MVPSPCCGERLKIIGSRNRKCKESSGEEKVLRIRRLRCVNCSSIHHELPDCLVPYKRYESGCVEQVLVESVPSDVAADDSTLHRWKAWFHEQKSYWIGCLTSIAVRFHHDPVKALSTPSQTAHHRLGQIVGDAPGWLARVVRPIANVNLWLHTRSAFLSNSSFGRLEFEV